MPAYAPASPTDPAGTRGRGVEAGHRPLLGQPGQVREARREPAERDREDGVAEHLGRVAAPKIAATSWRSGPSHRTGISTLGPGQRS